MTLIPFSISGSIGIGSKTARLDPARSAAFLTAGHPLRFVLGRGASGVSRRRRQSSRSRLSLSAPSPESLCSVTKPYIHIHIIKKMGKQKKKGRANNKKRGGGAGGPPNARGANAGEVDGVFRGDVPSFGESERGSPNYQTLYSSYKRATDRFLRYMRNNVPGVILHMFCIQALHVYPPNIHSLQRT